MKELIKFDEKKIYHFLINLKYKNPNATILCQKDKEHKLYISTYFDDENKTLNYFLNGKPSFLEAQLWEASKSFKPIFLTDFKNKSEIANEIIENIKPYVEIFQNQFINLKEKSMEIHKGLDFNLNAIALGRDCDAEKSVFAFIEDENGLRVFGIEVGFEDDSNTFSTHEMLYCYVIDKGEFIADGVECISKSESFCLSDYFLDSEDSKDLNIDDAYKEADKRRNTALMQYLEKRFEKLKMLEEKGELKDYLDYLKENNKSTNDGLYEMDKYEDNEINNNIRRKK